jgi:hypothetical protein
MREGTVIVNGEYWWHQVSKYSALALAQAQLWSVGGVLVLAFLVYLLLNIIIQLIRRLPDLIDGPRRPVDF